MEDKDPIFEMMEAEKCDCCGSLGGFHMEGCPRHCKSEVLIFSDGICNAFGTLESVFPEDWTSRYVRKEGGRFQTCIGMSYEEFFKFEKYDFDEYGIMLNDNRIDKQFVLKMLYHQFHSKYPIRTRKSGWQL